ncbi:MAG: hypothetical protein OHK0032_14700 [Thermodesulfovibrionales bacterium]
MRAGAGFEAKFTGLGNEPRTQPWSATGKNSGMGVNLLFRRLGAGNFLHKVNPEQAQR